MLIIFMFLLAMPFTILKIDQIQRLLFRLLPLLDKYRCVIQGRVSRQKTYLDYLRAFLPRGKKAVQAWVWLSPNAQWKPWKVIFTVNLCMANIPLLDYLSPSMQSNYRHNFFLIIGAICSIKPVSSGLCCLISSALKPWSSWGNTNHSSVWWI